MNNPVSPVSAAPLRFDSHVHLWNRWPYANNVPDPQTRAGVESLLEQLDSLNVARALVVCADIVHAENDKNHLLAQKAFSSFPRRFEFVADLDSSWKSSHHTEGALDRLKVIRAEAPDLAGITHYVDGNNDGWFRSFECESVFAYLAEEGLIASISASAEWLPDLFALAAAHPSVPTLIHHQGWVNTEASDVARQLSIVAAGAETPNVIVKASGFHYLTSRSWDYPYRTAHHVFRELLDCYGAHRMVWGSDFPASIGKTTYAQSLHVLEEALPDAAQHVFDALVGGTLQSILPSGTPQTTQQK